MPEAASNTLIETSINTLAKICHTQATNAGWWTDLDTGLPLQRNKGESLMLMVTELSEMYEGIRKPGLRDAHLPQFTAETVEAADTLIRLFDYAGAHLPDLAAAFQAKLEYNQTRADHKIANRLKPGGKKT